MRSHVISAVFKRNVASYFSGMIGYLFIVVFVVAGAFLAFNDQFFSSNLATLDQLSMRFPLLLLFIVPAITMTAWADERKLGTDELLFTLPATDLEILLGKYLAVLAVYTVALAFSLTHGFVLSWLGDPDWGLILTTYFGYWMAGAALLAAGMFASALTTSSTVAFVLGAAVCAIPVFIDQIPGIANVLRDRIGITEPLSVAGHLKGFTSGKVTFSGLFYFIGLTAFFLYLNAVLISRRHWAGGRKEWNMTGQFAIRVACLVVALMSLTYSLAIAGRSVDTTTERLHTLSPTTVDVLKKIPGDRPVTIQAFISPEVPQDFAPIRKDLINKLAEFDKRGGKNVQVRIVDVEPFSPASQEAEGLGIKSRPIQSEHEGRFSQQDVYLGAVLSSGYDTVTIPFFDRGTPIEYELTRSVGTVSQEERLVVGILGTDAKVNGGIDMAAGFQQMPKWEIVRELEKQYVVKEVSADSPIVTPMNVLIAILPSSLTQPQMDNLVGYISAGNPVLIFDDPAPIWGPGQSSGISLAPLEPKPSAGGGGMFGMQPPSVPKADAGMGVSLSRALGIEWNVRFSLFDTYNPHPKFADTFPKELVFLDHRDNISLDSAITSGLQEVLTFAPGFISGKAADVDVSWLLKSRSKTSGVNTWDKITRPGFFGGKQYSLDGPHIIDNEAHVIAARLKGKDGRKLNAIFVADMDIVHDQMFQVWQQQVLGLNIDNVLFVLNCVDELAGDNRFMDLRKRRAQHRTLTVLGERKKVFETRRSEEIAKADEAAEKELNSAKERMEKVVADLKQDMEKGSVDAGTVQMRLRNAEEAENRKLSQAEDEIEREKNERVRKVETETQQEIRQIENGVWKYAVLIPPLPAIILGLVVVLSRLGNERRGIARDRLRE